MAKIKGTAGNDTLHTLAGADLILGLAGNDRIFGGNGDTVDGGAGTDRLFLPSGVNNTVTVKNIEFMTGGNRMDMVTLNGALSNGTVNLGAGVDRLQLGAFHSAAIVSNTETILGLSNDQTVTLGARLTSGLVNLGAGGADILHMGGSASNLEVRNTETVDAAGGNQMVTLMGGGTVALDLGAGMDTVNIAGFSGSFTLQRVESLIDGSGDDSYDVTMSAATLDGDFHYLGGGGDDTLNILGNDGSYRCSVSNVETVNGSSSDDILVIRSAVDPVTVDLDAGYNILVLDDGADTDLTFTNVDMVIGDRGDDSITNNGHGALMLGGVGDDTLTSTANATDQLRGGPGDDTLLGGEGSDLLIGGPGKDFMDGSLDPDRMVFGPQDTGNTLDAADVIGGFVDDGFDDDFIDLTPFGLSFTWLGYEQTLDGTDPEITAQVSLAGQTEIYLNPGSGAGGGAFGATHMIVLDTIVASLGQDDFLTA